MLGFNRITDIEKVQGYGMHVVHAGYGSRPVQGLKIGSVVQYCMPHVPRYGGVEVGWRTVILYVPAEGGGSHGGSSLASPDRLAASCMKWRQSPEESYSLFGLCARAGEHVRCPCYARCA